jgi:hypothetical protein
MTAVFQAILLLLIGTALGFGLIHVAGGGDSETTPKP